MATRLLILFFICWFSEYTVTTICSNATNNLFYTLLNLFHKVFLCNNIRIFLRIDQFLRNLINRSPLIIIGGLFLRRHLSSDILDLLVHTIDGAHDLCVHLSILLGQSVRVLLLRFSLLLFFWLFLILVFGAHTLYYYNVYIRGSLAIME